MHLLYGTPLSFVCFDMKFFATYLYIPLPLSIMAKGPSPLPLGRKKETHLFFFNKSLKVDQYHKFEHFTHYPNFVRIMEHNPNGRFNPVLHLTTQQRYEAKDKTCLVCMLAIVKYFARLEFWGELWLENF